jgi:hypothetical protein
LLADPGAERGPAWGNGFYEDSLGAVVPGGGVVGWIYDGLAEQSSVRAHTGTQSVRLKSYNSGDLPWGESSVRSRIFSVTPGTVYNVRAYLNAEDVDDTSARILLEWREGGTPVGGDPGSGAGWTNLGGFGVVATATHVEMTTKTWATWPYNRLLTDANKSLFGISYDQLITITPTLSTMAIRFRTYEGVVNPRRDDWYLDDVVVEVAGT